MHKLSDFIKENIINLCLLKTKPENLIYSKFLFKILLAINIFIYYQGYCTAINFLNRLNTSIVINYPKHNFGQSLSVISCGLIGSILFIYICLIILKKQNRFVQLCSSLLIIDIAFRLGLILCMLIYNYYIYVSLAIMILLLFWQLIALSFIFSNGFDFSYFKTMMFVCFYMYLKYDVFNRLLINYFMPHNN